MSFATTSLVWFHSRHRGTERLVLLAIAFHVNDEKGGIAWPGVARLAQMVCASVRQVQRALHKLEKSGELRVFRNQGPGRTNVYRISLPPVAAVDVSGDNRVAPTVTPTPANGDAGDTQSSKESLTKSTPIVPNGDPDFWIETSFKCFDQAPHSIHPRLRRYLERIVADLDKRHAPSLQRFYHEEPVDTKRPPYTSRKHSPERLMYDLSRQLGLAIEACPPPPPKKEEPPQWREFFRRKYRQCNLPPSFFDLSRDLQEEYHRDFRQASANPQQR